MFTDESKLPIIKLTPPVWNSAAVYSPQREEDKTEITEPKELEKLSFKSQPTVSHDGPQKGKLLSFWVLFNT